MRQITKEAKRAFYSNQRFLKNNTEVRVSGNITELYLWGNLIARKEGNQIKITLSGWNTTTTRERLSAFASVYTRKGQAYINGQPVDNDAWIELN